MEERLRGGNEAESSQEAEGEWGLEQSGDGGKGRAQSYVVGLCANKNGEQM